MAHFQIENLTFSYAAAKGKHSLQDVNLTIEKGEYILFCIGYAVLCLMPLILELWTDYRFSTTI